MTAEVLGDISDLQSLLPYVAMSPSVFKAESTSGGLGLYTKERIHRGSLVLAERPCVSVSDASLLRQPWSNIDSSDTWAMALQVVADGMLHQTVDLHPRSQSDCIYDTTCIPSDILETLKDHTDLLKRCELNSIGYSTWPELIHGADRFSTFSGTGIFPLASLFNHSCDPNVFRYSLGDILVFRAARDIQPGEELFISYIPNEVLCEPRRIRRDFLGDRDFTCSCQKCMQGETELGIQIERLGVQMRAELRTLSREDRIENIQEFLADSAERLLHSDQLELRIMLATDLEISSQPEAAKKVWLEALNFAREKLPPFDFTLAVLAFHAGDLEFVKTHCLQYMEIVDFQKIFRYERLPS